VVPLVDLPPRRHVDWSYLPRSERAALTAREGASTADLGSLLTVLDELTSLFDSDSILHHAVEVARARLGMQRVSIFLFDERSNSMHGTWGTDLEGRTVDEHFITFAVSPGESARRARAARRGVFFEVVDQAPLVVHSSKETQVVGRGWVCTTPVRYGSELLGLMFNDAGLSLAPRDDGMQTRGALLAALVGMALHLARLRGDVLDPEGLVGRSPQTLKMVRLLGRAPSMTAGELGAQLGLSESRVARLFKREMGVSLVDYRNRLRLERFFVLLEKSGDNLLEAALAAGFGSYAQFHRVFVAERGSPPRQYLRAAKNEKTRRRG